MAVRGKPFQRGNSGKPKGAVGGRQKVVQMLDKLLSEPANVKLIKDALQAGLVKAPLQFIERFVMPLLPKESLVKLEGEAPAAVRIIMDAYPVAEGGDESAGPAGNGDASEA